MNTDPAEIAKFDAMASRWWDPEGDFKPLHQINPLRLDYIEKHARLTGRNVIDVGCGGGILAESMAARGARVTGIDMADAALAVARMHMIETGVKVDYRRSSAEDYARQAPATADVVLAEPLEHVPDPASLVKACADLVRPARRPVLLHHQSHAQGPSLRHRRRRVPAAHAADRHPRLRAIHPSVRTRARLPPPD